MWRKLMTRLSHDELQQAETDTFIGHHIERLNQHQENLSQLEITFNNYMVQTDRDVSALEGYVDCVRDSLVNCGGFVRYTEVTAGQRGHMRAQEKTNAAIFRSGQREPDNTDAAVTSTGVYAMASSSAAPTVADAGTPEEGGEEEHELQMKR
jgi:hypothetical protein